MRTRWERTGTDKGTVCIKSIHGNSREHTGYNHMEDHRNMTEYNTSLWGDMVSIEQSQFVAFRGLRMMSYITCSIRGSCISNPDCCHVRVFHHLAYPGREPANRYWWWVSGPVPSPLPDSQADSLKTNWSSDVFRIGLRKYSHVFFMYNKQEI